MQKLLKPSNFIAKNFKTTKLKTQTHTYTCTTDFKAET